MNRLGLRLSAFFLTFLLCSVAAHAAERALLQLGPGDVQLVTWGFILLFSTLGWASAELDEMILSIANVDDKPFASAWRARLAHVKGLVASETAGICVYFLGLSAPALIGFPEKSLPEMVLLISCTGAGIGGTKTLRWLLGRFFPTNDPAVIAPRSPDFQPK